MTKPERLGWLGVCVQCLKLTKSQSHGKDGVVLTAEHVFVGCMTSYQ